MGRVARAPLRTDLGDEELDAEILEVLQGGPARRPGRTPGLPRCPDHLTSIAAKEWRRIAGLLHGMGVLTTLDRAALAGYCQAYGRWVEAERRLSETPMLVRTPSGYVQQSPWLGIVNKQLELMGRFMVELGLTPAARSRVSALAAPAEPLTVTIRRFASEPLDAIAAPDAVGKLADAWLAKHGGEKIP